VIRGNVLTAAFEVEQTLDSILTEVFFPEPQSPPGSYKDSGNTERTLGFTPERRSLFDELFLKDRPASFGRKIDLFKRICTRVTSLGQLVSNDLRRSLGDVQKWRNRFAHYPVAFVPIGAPPHQELKAKLVLGDGEEELTEALLQKIDALFASTQHGLSSVLATLKGLTPS
jgi:hypothetical protein